MQTCQLEAVKLLIERGANLDGDYKSFITAPLHAVQYDVKSDRVLDVLNVLIDAGADVDIEGVGDSLTNNCYGWRPLHRAVLAGNLSAVKVLIDAGAQVNARTDVCGI